MAFVHRKRSVQLSIDINNSQQWLAVHTKKMCLRVIKLLLYFSIYIYDPNTAYMLLYVEVVPKTTNW